MEIRISNFSFMSATAVLCYLLVAEINGQMISRTMVISPAICTSNTRTAVPRDSSVSDFSDVTRSKNFIDKTNFIKDFLNKGLSVKVITAPLKSGKSSLIDMLKRFLAIPVNVNGSKIAPETTDNYRLFCQPKLKVCEDEAFVKQHMGQYPVIHIDFHKLKQVRCYDSLLQQLRIIIFDTFSQHKYLAQNSSLFVNEKERDFFMSHYNATDLVTATLIRSDIRFAFPMLSRLLYEHYGARVIVLLDAYDSYCTKLLFKQIEDRDVVISIIGGICTETFKHNQYLRNGVLTGVMRLKDVILNPTNNLMDYRWVNDNEFKKYFGLTEQEVKRLIMKYTNKINCIEHAESVINKYVGYELLDKQKFYNMLSILRFFKHM